MRKGMLYYLDKALGAALVTSTVVMVLVVLLQIVARFALPWSPDWTEEVARYSFIYLVSLGAGLAFKEGAYVNVTILLDKIKPRPRLYLEIIILVLVGALMLLLLVYSWPLLQIVKLQTSAALQLNMAFIYFSMLLLGFFVLLYALVGLTQKLKHF